MGKLLKISCLGLVALVAVIVVAVGAVALLAGGGSSLPGAEYEVVYEVTGKGGATKADMTFNTAATGSIAQEGGQALPWQKKLTFEEESISIFSLSVQNQGSGELTCTVTVDGEEVSTNTSSGRFSVVMCDASESFLDSL